MHTYGVDVRTPIFYRHTFASALEAQCGKVYAYLTHTPLIAEYLPFEVANGTAIEQYAVHNIHDLDELEAVLSAVLKEPPSSNVGLSHAATSTYRDGVGELKTASLSPPSCSISRGTAAIDHIVSRGGLSVAEQTPPAVDIPSRRGICFSFFRDDKSTSAEKSDKEYGSAPARATDKAGGRALVLRLREWIKRFLGRRSEQFYSQEDALSASLHARQRGPVGVVPLSHSQSGITTGSAVGNVTAGRVRHPRVPEWVRASFGAPTSFSAGALAGGAGATQSMRCPRPPVVFSSGHLSETATASKSVETRETTSLHAPVAVSQTFMPCPIAVLSDHVDSGMSGAHQGDREADEVQVASNPTQTPCSHRDGYFLGERVMTSSPPAPQMSSVTLRFSESDVSLHHKEDESLQNGEPSRLQLPQGNTVTVHTASTSDGARGTVRFPSPASLTSTHVGDAQDTQRGVSGSKARCNWHQPPLLPHHEAASSGATRWAAGFSIDLRSRGLSFSWNSPWHSGETQSFPTSQDAGSVPQAAVSAPPSTGKHAHTTELVGWLHLLVWVRWQVIYFLRDLSGVQGFVAWCAWYWSWAQDHPRQAAFHQGLSSIGFWKGVWSRGLHTQLNQVQYSIRRHMFTLRSVFQLIVSYIGAVYTALDTLNTRVVQVQRSCEVLMSTVAAAAAVAVGGASTGLAGGILTTAPFPATAATARRDGVGRDDACQSHPHNTFCNSCMDGSFSIEGFFPARRQSDRGGASQGGLKKSVRGSTNAPVETSAPHEDHYEVGAKGEEAAPLSGNDVGVDSSSHALDELRCAVWSTLQELKAIFCHDGLPPDLAEVNDQVRFPCSEDYGGIKGNRPSRAGSATVATAGPDGQDGLHQSNNRSSSAMSTPEAAPTHQAGDAHMHFPGTGFSGVGEGCEPSGSRHVDVREGAQVLLHCVQHSQQLLQRLTLLVQRSHSPPAARHWRRMLVASVTLLPPFVWLYTKSPAELATIVRKMVVVGKRVIQSYVIDPMTKLRESLSYVRPGAEDRRGAVERDAVSLANIIRDFHEDMYPNMPQKRLEELRARTFRRLRAGVADPEGLGLIDEQYRQSVRHPIRSILFGDLPRIMLIQLSYQALEVSRVANGIDEVLEGNDINFKIMAMMPVFLAVGLLATWGLFRRRSKYKPARLRMKLLWRSLHRVVSFAGSSQGLFLPPLRINTTHQGPRRQIGANTLLADSSQRNLNMPQALQYRRRKGLQRRIHPPVDATGATLVSTWPPGKPERVGAGNTDEVNIAATSGLKSDSETSSDASASDIGGAVLIHQLNNYEQGMVLLLSHVMRSIATEYLRSYTFYHEFMEDLNDLESVQSTRRQRLATLRRMRATHTHFF